MFWSYRTKKPAPNANRGVSSLRRGRERLTESFSTPLGGCTSLPEEAIAALCVFEVAQKLRRGPS